MDTCAACCEIRLVVASCAACDAPMCGECLEGSTICGLLCPRVHAEYEEARRDKGTPEPMG